LDFVAEAWDDSDLYDWSNEEDGGYGSSTGNGLDGGTTSGSASGDGEESSAMPGADLSPTPPPAADPITAAALPTPPTPPPPVEAPLSPVPSAPPMEEEFEEAMLEVSPSPSFGLPPPAYDTVASASDPSIVGSTSSARREAAAGAPAAPAAEQDRRGAGIASGVRHDKSMDVEEPLASSRAATAHVPPSSAPRNAVAKRGPPWAANDPSSGGPFGTSSSSSGRIESEVDLIFCWFFSLLFLLMSKPFSRPVFIQFYVCFCSFVSRFLSIRACALAFASHLHMCHLLVAGVLSIQRPWLRPVQASARQATRARGVPSARRRHFVSRAASPRDQPPPPPPPSSSGTAAAAAATGQQQPQQRRSTAPCGEVNGGCCLLARCRSGTE